MLPRSTTTSGTQKGGLAVLIVATRPPLRRPFDDAQFSQPATEQQQQQEEPQQVQVNFALLGLFYDLA